MTTPPAEPWRLNRLGLAATMLAVSIAAVDVAIANTALPTIAAALKVSPAQAVWVVNAYQLAMAATLLPFAALAEWIGPRRVCLGGLIGALLAAAACMSADGFIALTLARALQGVSAGALMSVNMVLVRMLFPPHRLGRGVGLNAAVVGTGVTLGPTISSAVLALGDWRWLFAVGVPMALGALACGWRGLPQRPPGPRPDGWGAALTAATFAFLIGALSTAAQRRGWGLPVLLALLALGFMAAQLRRQAGDPAPVLPVDLLRKPRFALSIATAVAAFTGQGLAFVGLPFHFQHHLGHDAVTTGLLMTPWAAVVAAAAPVAGWVSDRIAPARLAGAGMALLSMGFISLALLPPGAEAAAIVPRMMLCGLGFGLFQAPNLNAIMGAAPPGRLSGASALVAMGRLGGQTLGAAAVALCFALAGTQGSSRALWLGALAAALASGLSLARLVVR